MIRAARIVWVFIVTSIWLAAASCVFWDKPPTVEAPPTDDLFVSNRSHVCQPAFPALCSPAMRPANPRLRAEGPMSDH